MDEWNEDPVPQTSLDTSMVRKLKNSLNLVKIYVENK